MIKKRRKIKPIYIIVFIFSWYFFGLVYKAFAAEDITWHKNNADILVNNSIIEDAIRYISWGITKLVCLLADICQGLYDKTFGLIDLTNYPSINKIIVSFKPVLIALTVLCVVAYGIMLMVTNEKKPVVSNILLSILAVSCSLYLFTTANSLVKSFKNGVLEKDGKYQSYQIVNNNMIDLVGIDKAGNISNLNYKAGTGIVHNAGINSKTAMNEIKYTETLNWDDKERGKDLYKWSDTFNNLIKYRSEKVLGTYIPAENYDGVLATTIGNEFFYRYNFDFWSAILQLISLIMMFVALSYKNVRIAYELVVSRIMAFMYAADVGSGQKLKQILMFIRDTYITLCVSVLCVKLYTIFTEAMPSFGITGISKGIVSIFIAYAVIDGPNLVERILGMDAGLRSSVGRTMALLSLARSGIRGGRKVAGGAGRAVATGVTGKTAFSRKSEKHNPTAGDRVGMFANKVMTGKKKNSERGKDTKNTGIFNQDNTGSVNPNINDNTNSQNNKNNENVSSSQNTGYMSSPQNTSSKENDGYNTSFMDSKPSGSENSSRSYASARASTNDIKTRYKNPGFSSLARKLAPDENASKGEKKDWHKQMDAIVKGDHKAIKPKKGAKEKYKFTNYEKAKRLEEAYHKKSKEEDK